MVGLALSLILYFNSYTPAALPAATCTFPSFWIVILATGWVVWIVTSVLLSPVVAPNLSLSNTLRSLLLAPFTFCAVLALNSMSLLSVSFVAIIALASTTTVAVACLQDLAAPVAVSHTVYFIV